MAVGRTFEEALGKALRSLETGRAGFGADGRGEEAALSDEELFAALSRPTAERIFLAAEALRRGMSAEELHERTAIDPFFCARMADMVAVQEALRGCALEDMDAEAFQMAKRYGLLRRRDRRAHRVRRAHGARMPQDPRRAPGLQDCGHLRGGVPHEDRLPLQDLRRRRVRGGGQGRARAPSSWAPAPTASARASSSTTAACTPATRWPTPGTRPSW